MRATTPPPLRVFCALALSLLASLAAAQPLPSPEEGRVLYQQRYGWVDYGQHSQNWAVAQDPRGIVYVGNTNGLLEYDGETWRFVDLLESNVRTVRSIAVAPDGRVFIGGTGEIGVLETDAAGELHYQSLVGMLPAAARDFGDVWTAFADDEATYFQSFRWLARWDGRRMRVWQTSGRFHKAFQAGGSIYVREEGVGLRRVVGDRLPLVAGGDAFAGRSLFALLPHPRGLLAAVRDEGLFTLAPGGTLTPVETDASEWLRRFAPYNGVVVDNPYGRGHLYVIGTLGGGVVVADEAGRLVRRYGEDVGLSPEDYVLHLAPDAQGGVWLALLSGIKRFDLFPRLTTFGQEDGLPGAVYEVTRFQGALYVATSNGVFRLREGGLGKQPGDYALFEPVLTNVQQCWSLATVGGSLLAATNFGVYQIEGSGARLIDSAQAFALLPADGGRVYVGKKDGAGVLEQDSAGRWHYAGSIAGVGEEIRSLERDASGNLWMAPLQGGLLRMDRAGRIARLAPGGGMPSGSAAVFRQGEALLVATRTGLRRLETRPGGLALRPLIGLSGLPDNYVVHLTNAGDFWIHDGDALRRLRPEPGGAFTDLTPPGIALRNTQVKSFLNDVAGVVWIGTENGLLRYDERVQKAPPHFPAYVRRVTDRQRNTLYGGAYGKGQGYSLTPTPEDLLVLPFDRRGLRFEFSSASFADAHETQYQIMLDGFDEEWTPWATDHYAEFTNLPERSAYRFLVRARDSQGFHSETGVYTFRVLPPWYRTWWAYTLYVLALLTVIWSVSAWRLRKHRRKLEAHRMFSMRLDRLNARLRDSNARLRDADRTKDELLANTSHELRTPLTAILGFTEILLAEVGEDLRDVAEAVYRGGQRLLTTVNGLLDMAKLQAGTLEIAPARHDVDALARTIAESLRPIATARGLYLHVFPEPAEVAAMIDAGCLERVLTNLVGNALKFTETGGVSVLVDADETHVRLTVRDTGIGMPEDFLPRLYLPFEQASQGYSRSHEGTGLGLAIVKQTVDLMGGQIAVATELGHGTAFTVSFPRWADLAEVAPGSAADAARASVLGGSRVLALHADDRLLACLRRVVEPYGEVVTAETLGRAVRLSRKQAFDMVVFGEGPPEVEVRWLRVLRNVPGYAAARIVRATPSSPDSPEGRGLLARGYSCLMPVPVDHAVLTDLLTEVLTHVEAEAE